MEKRHQLANKVLVASVLFSLVLVSGCIQLPFTAEPTTAPTIGPTAKPTVTPPVEVAKEKSLDEMSLQLNDLPRGFTIGVQKLEQQDVRSAPLVFDVLDDWKEQYTVTFVKSGISIEGLRQYGPGMEIVTESYYIVLRKYADTAEYRDAAKASIEVSRGAYDSAYIPAQFGDASVFRKGEISPQEKDYSLTFSKNKVLVVFRVSIAGPVVEDSTIINYARLIESRIP